MGNRPSKGAHREEAQIQLGVLAIVPHPLKRVVERPRERPVFLAGDEGAWITGQDFGVDGGLNIPVMPSMAPIAERLYGADLVRRLALPDLTALNVEGDR